MKTHAERTAEHRARRIETIANTLAKSGIPIVHGSEQAGAIEIATAIEDQLNPPAWTKNPMERDALILTHYYRCSATGRHYSVTVQGAFYESERTARKLVAEQLCRLSAIQTTDPDDALTMEAAFNRLQPLHTTEVERVVEVKTWMREYRKEIVHEVELRSQVVTP